MKTCFICAMQRLFEFKIFGLETIKDQYVHDAEFKDVLQNWKEELGTSSFLTMDLCFVLTSYAF